MRHLIIAKRILSVSAILLLTASISYASSWGIIDYGVVRIDAADIQKNSEAIRELNAVLSGESQEGIGLVDSYNAGYEKAYDELTFELIDNGDGTHTLKVTDKREAR